MKGFWSANPTATVGFDIGLIEGNTQLSVWIPFRFWWWHPSAVLTASLRCCRKEGDMLLDKITFSDKYTRFILCCNIKHFGVFLPSQLLPFCVRQAHGQVFCTGTMRLAVSIVCRSTMYTASYSGVYGC